jgi:hypothetical protein
VALFFIAGTPAEIVLALLWKARHPPFIARLMQPARGIVLTTIAVLSGFIVGAFLFRFVGAGIGPPTPMLLMFTMLSVVTILWLILIWECWPFSTFIVDQTALGAVTLVAAYASAVPIFKLAFNFSFLSQATVYVATLDPKGWFNAWTALSALVTTVAVMLLIVLLEFWPLRRVLSSCKQPISGLLASTYVLFVSAALWWVSRRVIGLDAVEHLVRVAIPVIYGVFLVDLMTCHKLFITWRQPQRGLTLSGVALGLASLLYPLYAHVGRLLTGSAMASGPPTYELEIWVATAMLGITFPLMVVVAEFFDFWPSRGQTSM